MSGDIRWLREAANRVRYIRNRTCEPKNNTNRRYLELCVAVSSLEWVARDLEAEDESNS